MSFEKIKNESNFIFRVFYDRLIDDKDRETFIGILSENLGSYFDQTYHNICSNKQPPIFGKIFLLNSFSFIKYLLNVFIKMLTLKQFKPIF
jgi:hypothetical protein